MCKRSMLTLNLREDSRSVTTTVLDDGFAALVGAFDALQAASIGQDDVLQRRQLL